MAVTKAPPRDERAAAPLVECHYEDGQSAFDAHAGPTNDVHLVVRGRGTMAGVHAMLDFFAQAEKALGGESARIYYDLTEVRGVPLRSQLLFGKWFLNHRKFVRRAAIVGAGAFERRLASAVCAIAGIRNFRFFDLAPEARAWLFAEETPA